MARRLDFGRHILVSIAGAFLLLMPFLSQAANSCLPAPQNLREQGALTIGVALSSPPMDFVLNDKPAGFDPDMMKALAKAMCLEPKFVNVAFSGLFPGLISKKFDVVTSSVGITAAREKVFDFLPYFRTGVRLVAKKGSPLFFHTEADVCGHTASITSGSIEMAALERVINECAKDKPMVLKSFSGQIEALNEVSRGTADAAYVDWPVAAYIILQRPNDFQNASPILSGDGPNTPRHRLGVVMRKDEPQMNTAIQGAFKSLLDSGEYDALLKKWNQAGGDIRHTD